MNKGICNSAIRIRKGRVFDFFAETVTLPNGVRVEMEIIRHPGAAAVVAILEDDRILLLSQYRYAVGGYIWEIPAGTLNPGEDARQCAARELTEETGYAAGNLEKLGEMTPLPAYSDERIHLFLASGLTRQAQQLDRDELLVVHPVDPDRAAQMIAQGEIQDAKTIVGLQLAAAHRARGRKQSISGG